MRVLISGLLLLVLLGPSGGEVFAQAASDQVPAYLSYRPFELVDCPTAGTLKRASFNGILRVYPNGGLLGSLNIGLSDRFMVGLSYGAEEIISENDPEENPRIEFSLKYSLIDETFVMPAFSVGFSSQGFGSYVDRLERYTYKSKGFYVVASKNYERIGLQWGTHGGINYSIEREEGPIQDDNIDFFVGTDVRLNDDIAMVVEYDFALNDNSGDLKIAKGRGYLHMAFQWLYAENLVMELILKNLTNNRYNVNSIGRGLRVTYTESF
jgi:hypothetical protein